jgi:hypothetical protein
MRIVGRRAAGQHRDAAERGCGRLKRQIAVPLYAVAGPVLTRERSAFRRRGRGGDLMASLEQAEHPHDLGIEFDLDELRG